MSGETYLEIFEQHQIETPCYLFDKDVLLERVSKLKQLLRTCGAELCFAIKANPFLIPMLDEVISKYEVCSPGELDICKKYGIKGEKIIFSGVVKSFDDMLNALEYPVGVITIESVRHWVLLKEAVKKTGKNTQVLIRLSSGAQFGMEKEEIRQVLNELQEEPAISFMGIHFFAGTQRKGNKYEKELPKLAAFMEELQEEFQFEEMRLEYGPGVAVPYFSGDSFDGEFDVVSGFADYVNEQRFSFGITVELGRYIAASCGYYVTQIVDIKKAEERNYCLVDGGIHHVNYYGQNMAMRTPIMHHLGEKEETDDEREYMICGSLCTFADILARGVMLKNLQIGDFLIFENIGAYSVTEGNYLFLSRELPSIYVYSREKGIQLLREKRGTWEINSIKNK